MLRVSKRFSGFNRGAPDFFLALALEAVTYIAEPAEAQMGHALLAAAATGSAGAVNRILSAGANVNARNDNGANVNKASYDGARIALKVAQVMGHWQIVEILQKYGAVQ